MVRSQRSLSAASVAVVLCAAALLAPAIGLADAVTIPAPDRADMVFDTLRGLLYITSGNSVLRYDLNQSKLLQPLTAPEGSRLMGVDLSPDCSTLVAADATGSQGAVCVHVADLQSGTLSTQEFPAVEGETGTHAVAFARDGTVFVTSRSGAGRAGTVPMRRYDPRSGEWVVALEGAPHATMVSASADRAVIGFAGNTGGKVSGSFGGGCFGLIRVATGEVVKAERPQPAYEVALNADGTQLAVPGMAGVAIYDQTLAAVGTVPSPGSAKSLSAAYSPVMPFLQVAWGGGPIVGIYDTRDFERADSYQAPSRMEAGVATAFEGGRLRVSRDGSMLACAVEGGVWVTGVYQSPWAHDQSLATNADTAVPVKLTASVMGNAQLTYQIDTKPEHGSLTGTMQDLSYMPNRGYTGKDSFTFRARNGDRQSAVAVVSISVGAGAGAAGAGAAQAGAARPGDGTARCFALVYGCAEYGGADGEGNLWLVPCNVAQVANCLRARMGIPGQTMTVRVDEVGQEGDEITPELVKGDIAQVAARADGDDILFFYFCGHGNTYPQGGANSERLCLSRGDLSDRDLGAALAQVPCAYTIVLLDACFSGGFAVSPDELTGECASLQAGQTVYVVAASERTRAATGYSFPQEWPWLGATLFTPLFCEAVEGGMPAWKRGQIASFAGDIPLSSDENSDGVITLLEAFTYAQRACVAISARMGERQTPVMGPQIPTQVTDFVLARPLPPEVLASQEAWLEIEITGTKGGRTEAGAGINIAGVVKDRQGRPVPGVRLMVNDALVGGDRSSPGMVTDQDGHFTHFSLSAKPHGPVVFFTFWCPGADPVRCMVDARGI